MSHLSLELIHAYQNRAKDIRVSVETSEDTADFSAIVFTAGDIEKSGLTADDTTDGFNVDFTLTTADLSVDTGVYDWELKASLAGEVRSVARGKLRVDP